MQIKRTFENRIELEAWISEVSKSPPIKRDKTAEEKWIFGKLLSAISDQIEDSHFPINIEQLSKGKDPPDFKLIAAKSGNYEIEITEATKEKYKCEKSNKIDAKDDFDYYEVECNGAIRTYKKGEPITGMGYSGNRPEQIASEIIYDSIVRKNLVSLSNKYVENFLLIYYNFSLPTLDYDVIIQFLMEKIKNEKLRSSYDKTFLLQGSGILYSHYLDKEYNKQIIKKAFKQ
ncbi:hypothetical protein H8D57_02500 [bacterium]|nr:hypothetical protein [bacterium]